MSTCVFFFVILRVFVPKAFGIAAKKVAIKSQKL